MAKTLPGVVVKAHFGKTDNIQMLQMKEYGPALLSSCWSFPEGCHSGLEVSAIS